MDIWPVCKILIPALNYETLFGVRALEKLGIHCTTCVREVASMRSIIYNIANIQNSTLIS